MLKSIKTPRMCLAYKSTSFTLNGVVIFHINDGINDSGSIPSLHDPLRNMPLASSLAILAFGFSSFVALNLYP